MEDNLIIPWAQVVKMKKDRDEHLLQTIDHYRTISETAGVAELSRIEAKRLMKQYQRIYLGLPTNGL